MPQDKDHTRLSRINSSTVAWRMASQNSPAATAVQQETDEAMGDERIARLKSRLDSSFSEMEEMKQMLAQLATAGDAAGGEARATETSSQEFGGALERVVVSGGPQRGKVDTRIRHRKEPQQGRRSPSPAGIVQGFRGAENYTPVQDVASKEDHWGGSETAEGDDPERESTAASDLRVEGILSGGVV